MTKNYKAELGQIAFDRPFFQYNLPEYAQACLNYILAEVGRVYWNTNQKRWE